MSPGLTVATIACSGLAVVAAQGRSEPVSGGGRPSGAGVVLVSGRDDHGLLATPSVALSDTPEGQPGAQVPDATLVAVVATRGEWLEVRTITGAAAQGWVNDFSLRAGAHLRAAAGRCNLTLAERPEGPGTIEVPANTQAKLLEVTEVGGTIWVKARPAGHPAGWIERSAVHELPGDRVVQDQGTCRTIARGP